MAVDYLSEDGSTIRKLIPLSTLSASKFEAMCEDLDVQEAENGEVLFRYGDVDPGLYYLLKGSVNLQIDNLKIETIDAGSESARFSLAHQIPRKVNVIANGRIRYLRLNPDMMKSAQYISNEESVSNMVDDEELLDDDDWMTTLLKSPIFRGLPPANLQKILMSLQEVRFHAGESIIKQGDPGDFYYIIKKGQCLVSRKPSPNAKEVKLGQLSDQDSFGEDALISGEPRNVTITALSDVSLLRLSKEQFVVLIKQPMLKYVTYQEAMALVADGAELIDVQEPDEYKKQHLAQSVNVPLFSLRMQMKTFNRLQPVVAVCRNGKASETAAFILIRHRFNALVLQGGLDNNQGVNLMGTALMQTQSGDAVSAAGATPRHADNVIHDHDQLLHNLQSQLVALQTEKAALEQKCAVLTQQVTALQAELQVLRQ